jgi:hypothetical protein
MADKEKIERLERELEELKKRLELLEKSQGVDDVEMTRMLLRAVSSNKPAS